MVTGVDRWKYFGKGAQGPDLNATSSSLENRTWPTHPRNNNNNNKQQYNWYRFWELILLFVVFFKENENCVWVLLYPPWSTHKNDLNTEMFCKMWVHGPWPFKTLLSYLYACSLRLDPGIVVFTCGELWVCGTSSAARTGIIVCSSSWVRGFLLGSPFLSLFAFIDRCFAAGIASLELALRTCETKAHIHQKGI